MPDDETCDGTCTHAVELRNQLHQLETILEMTQAMLAAAAEYSHPPPPPRRRR